MRAVLPEAPALQCGDHSSLRASAVTLQKYLSAGVFRDGK